MYILATTRTEAHTTPHTCIVGSRTTNSAEMAAGGRAWRSHCCFQIGGDMRWQRFKICLFYGKTYVRKAIEAIQISKAIYRSHLLITSCKSSRNVLGAFLASRAFACRVLRLVPLGCFFCIYPAPGVHIIIPFPSNITNNCSSTAITAWLSASTKFEQNTSVNPAPTNLHLP